MKQRIEDRFRGETGGWEMIGRPFTMSAGKVVVAPVRRVGDADGQRAARSRRAVTAVRSADMQICVNGDRATGSRANRA